MIPISLPHQWLIFYLCSLTLSLQILQMQVQSFLIFPKVIGNVPSPTDRFSVQSLVFALALITQHFSDRFCIWFCVCSSRLWEALCQRSFPVAGWAASLSGMRLKEGGVLLLNLSKGGLFSRKSTFKTDLRFSRNASFLCLIPWNECPRQLKQPESLVWAAHISKFYLKVVAYVIGDSEDCYSILEYR